MHNKEKTKLLPRYQTSDTPELQRLVMLGQRFGIVPALFHTVNKEELGIPMPAGMAEDPIQPFPTPGRGIKKITSSAAKMLGRLYAEYVYLCSFAHGLPQANLFKNIFDSRFPDRRFVRDSEVKNRYQQQVVSKAYITSFMSIALYGRTHRTVSEQYGNYRSRMPRLEAALESKYGHEGRMGDSHADVAGRDFVIQGRSLRGATSWPVKRHLRSSGLTSSPVAGESAM
jgi:hypothetical protein